MKPVVLLALVTFAIGCKKAKFEAYLPDATQTGANTMGCLVDGEVHTYNGMNTSGTHSGVSFYFSPNDSLATIGGQVGILNFDNTAGSVDMHLHTAVLKRDSVFNPSTNTSYYHYSTNYVVVENDPFNKVVFTRIDDNVAAGTFQFKAFDNSGDSVLITQGRFDIAR